MKSPPWKRLSAALPVLQDCSSPADLGPTLLKSMQMLLDADVYAVNWFGAEKILDVSYYASPASQAVLENSRDILNSHLHEHPLLPMVNATRTDGVTRANRWSDVITLRDFRKTGLYHDFYRILPSDRQVCLVLRIDGTVFLSLTFNRQGLDFHTEDARALEAFSPTVRYAVRTMLDRAKLEDALALRELAIGGDAVVIVDESGKALFATDRAREILPYYFSTAKEGLPPELRAWLKSNPPAGASLSRQRAVRRLVCVCGHSMPWPGSGFDAIFNGGADPTRVRLLRFTEERDSDLLSIPFPTPEQLQKIGLTPRESEILFWVMQGKRDPEIVTILSEKGSVSIRTVNNHVRSILAKMDAETRTGASMNALERIKNV